LIRKKSTALNLLILVTVISASLVWTGDYFLNDRVVTLRYLLFALSGFMAFITPYLLFPDPSVILVQLANLNRRRLVKHVLSGFLRYQWPILILIAFTMLGDLREPLVNLGDKILLLLHGEFLFAGITLLSLSRYMRSGAESQFWQESEKGLRIRKQIADYMKYPLDPGSIPSMINTLLVSAAGMIAVVAGAYLNSSYGSAGELCTGVAVLALGLLSFLQLRKQTERNYYASNAFFNEFFDSGNGHESTVGRRKADQLWWVPAGLRAGVWQFLQQIDRKIPAGRTVTAGHLFVWFVAYQRPGEEFMTALWILFAMAHHMFILLTLQSSMAPAWLCRWVDSGSNWFLIRFWMQIRWLLPIYISMILQQFVFGYPLFQDQLIVLIIYIASGAILSAAGVIHMNRSVQ
jgi:hypothetical protein